MGDKLYFRHFDGIPYEYVLCDSSKTRIQRKAKEIRKKGYGARIIRDSEGDYNLYECQVPLKRSKK